MPCPATSLDQVIRSKPSNKCTKNMDYVKFIYSEKATKNLRNLHLFLTDTSTSQKKVEISQTFCGLLRIYEF